MATASKLHPFKSFIYSNYIEHFPFLWPDSSIIPIVFKHKCYKKNPIFCNDPPWIAAALTEPENTIASGQRAQGDERQTVVKESCWFKSSLTALGFKEREKTQKCRCSPTGWIVQDLNPWSPKPLSEFHHPKRFVQSRSGKDHVLLQAMQCWTCQHWRNT